MTSSSNSSSDLAMNTLSVTLTNTRAIDGLIFAANSAGMSPEAYAERLLTTEGHRFADANSYGVVTSAGFFARFTPAEYADVLAASEAQNAAANAVKALLDELTAAEKVALDDQRVADGLALLVSMELLAASRPAEITAYDRPFPGGE
jgi:hypothetical protein